MNKANHIENGDDDSLDNTRPLFSSAWLALFNELRHQYSERRLPVSTRPERVRPKPEKQQRMN